MMMERRCLDIVFGHAVSKMLDFCKTDFDKESPETVAEAGRDVHEPRRNLRAT